MNKKSKKYRIYNGLGNIAITLLISLLVIAISATISVMLAERSIGDKSPLNSSKIKTDAEIILDNIANQYRATGRLEGATLFNSKLEKTNNDNKDAVYSIGYEKMSGVLVDTVRITLRDIKNNTSIDSRTVRKVFGVRR